MINDNEPPIEVEVLEIDGVAPSKPSVAADDGIRPDDESASGPTWANWQGWPGQARRLHPFWWPVLALGGGILLVVLLTVGLVLGVLFVIFRLIRGLLRALFS